MSDLPSLLQQRFGEAILSTDAATSPPAVDVRRERIGEILRFLRDDPAALCDCLTDLCGVDHLDRGEPGRFAVVYHLFSFSRRHRIRIRAWIPETDPEIDTATALWPAADWAEREAFDLYGIRFRGHPDLRRILLPDDYEGHPLRKDYPLRGHGERGRFPKYVP